MIHLILGGMLALLQPSGPRISAADARTNIGKYKEVDGYFHHAILKKVPSSPDSALEIIYISAVLHGPPVFVNVIKVKLTKKNGKLLTRLGVDIERVLKKGAAERKDELIGALGKVILFNGLPAIIIQEEDSIILEPVS